MEDNFDEEVIDLSEHCLVGTYRECENYKESREDFDVDERDDIDDDSFETITEIHHFFPQSMMSTMFPKMNIDDIEAPVTMYGNGRV